MESNQGQNPLCTSWVKRSGETMKGPAPSENHPSVGVLLKADQGLFVAVSKDGTQLNSNAF